MKPVHAVRSVLVLAAAGLLAGAAVTAVTIVSAGGSRAGALQARIAQTYLRLPMRFAPNRGQLDPGVRFAAQGPGYAVLLSPRGALLSLRSPARATSLAKPSAGRVAALGIGFVGSRGGGPFQGLNHLSGVVNSFSGSSPSRWRTSTPTYGRVRHAGVWPGIGIDFYGGQRQLEYDFNVAPGADPHKIRLAFTGAQNVRVDRQGDLLLAVNGGVLRQLRPMAYQWLGGRRQPVASRWVVAGREARVSVGPYDRHRPLVIDPVISYSTFLGGSGKDSGEGIAVDSAGNAYVTGDAGSTNFPTTSHAYQQHAAAAPDVFVSKLNPSGTGLVYSTYVGGNAIDLAGGIAVDKDGNAYVTGITDSTDFPTKNAYQGTLSGPTNAFLFKLSAAGDALVYSTYLGGKSFNQGSSVAVDSAENAYVVGVTRSSDFPTLNAAQPSYGGGFADAFVTKFAPAGNTLVYSTYLGGTGDDEGGAVALDGAGNAYVTGQTDSTNFPLKGALQPNNKGGIDGFVTKLSASGSMLVYSTYLGGTGTDTGAEIAVDRHGRAYVAGNTTSTDLATVKPFQATNHGGTDGFLARLSASGGSLDYLTYIGGSGDDRSGGLALGRGNSVYLTGNTKSTDFPTKNPIQATNAGGLDAWVAKFKGSGKELSFSTYLGGKGDDSGNAIAVDRSGAAYVAGETTSSDFPTKNALQPTFGGVSNAFVTKIAPKSENGGDEGDGGDHQGGGDQGDGGD